MALRVDWRLLAARAARRDAVVVVREHRNTVVVVREHRRTAASIYLAAKRQSAACRLGCLVPLQAASSPCSQSKSASSYRTSATPNCRTRSASRASLPPAPAAKAPLISGHTSSPASLRAAGARAAAASRRGSDGTASRNPANNQTTDNGRRRRRLRECGPRRQLSQIPQTRRNFNREPLRAAVWRQRGEPSRRRRFIR